MRTINENLLAGVFLSRSPQLPRPCHILIHISPTLYCTVLYCTVLYCHILTHISQLQPQAVQRCCHISCFTSSHWPVVHQNPSRWPEIEVTGDAVRQLMRCNVELQTDFDHHWLVKILYGLEDIYISIPSPPPGVLLHVNHKL